ncbi:integrase, catalytic region, zinc finger, CCHC-type containing protein [Tanacetum coccineum]
MATLADKAILSGADNCPPMLEKELCDSWKSIIELYIMNIQHGIMILESVENGPLVWPTIEVNGVTRPRKYSELTAADAIQAYCHVKATNIILQGLPTEIYALVSHHKVAKDLWEIILLLMQGTSLKKQERECNDPIDSINHMISFLTVVVTSRYPTTNNQLRNLSNPRTYTPGASGSNSGNQRTVICYTCKGEGHMSKQCTKNLRVNGYSEGQSHTDCHVPTDAAYQRDDWMHMTLNVMNSTLRKTVQEMPSSEQSSVVNQSETEITSNSNIIPYSQYVIESQQAVVQKSTLPVQTRCIDNIL